MLVNLLARRFFDLSADDVIKLLKADKGYLEFDTALFMQRFSHKTVGELNDLISSVNVDNLSPEDVIKLCEFAGIEFKQFIDEYCVYTPKRGICI